MLKKFMFEVRRNQFLSGIISEQEYLTTKIPAKNEKYLNYNNFYDFFTNEYGFDFSDDFLALAIKEWFKYYDLGIFPPDYDGVAKYVNKKILEMIKFGVN